MWFAKPVKQRHSANHTEEGKSCDKIKTRLGEAARDPLHTDESKSRGL